MAQQKILARLALVVLALVLLSALPALAGATPAAAPASPAMAPPSGCPASASGFGDFGGFGDLAPRSVPVETAALPAWLELGSQAASTTVFHRYCHCTCSRTPDCNTDADCSNHRCLGAISCC